MFEFFITINLQKLKTELEYLLLKNIYDCFKIGKNDFPRKIANTDNYYDIVTKWVAILKII